MLLVAFFPSLPNPLHTQNLQPNDLKTLLERVEDRSVYLVKQEQEDSLRGKVVSASLIRTIWRVECLP